MCTLARKSGDFIWESTVVGVSHRLSRCKTTLWPYWRYQSSLHIIIMMLLHLRVRLGAGAPWEQAPYHSFFAIFPRFWVHKFFRYRYEKVFICRMCFRFEVFLFLEVVSQIQAPAVSAFLLNFEKFIWAHALYKCTSFSQHSTLFRFLGYLLHKWIYLNGLHPRIPHILSFYNFFSLKQKWIQEEGISPPPRKKKWKNGIFTKFLGVWARKNNNLKTFRAAPANRYFYGARA